MLNIPTRYVVDTHALWWFFTSPDRLSAAAAAIFRLTVTGDVTIVIPAIVVAEYYYLSVKEVRSISPSAFMAELDTVGGIEVSPLDRRQLEMLDRLPEIPEMHDRLIAAAAAALGAPVITRDPVLVASPQIETIW